MSPSRPLALICLLALAWFPLKGCIGAATVAGAAGAGVAAQNAIRAQHIDLATAGDAAAQTKVGLTHCCMGPGYSAQKATEWLCKAARQDHPQAFYELGRIYIGEIWRIPHPGTYVAGNVISKKDLDIAFMWLRLAEEAGIKKARRKIRGVRENNPGREIWVQQQYDKAGVLMQDWRNQPCTYDEVFKRA